MKYYFSKSSNGWQTSNTFMEYVKKIIEEMRLRGVEGPIVLIADGFPGHLNLDLQKYCNSKDVIYVILLPNATHLIQPLDVAVFKSVKNEYKIQSSLYKREKGKTDIIEEDFIKILAATLKNSVTPELVKKSFEVTGLFPLKTSRISDSRIISHGVSNQEKENPPANLIEIPQIVPEITSITNDPTQVLDIIDQQMKFLEQIRKSHIEKGHQSTANVQQCESSSISPASADTQMLTEILKYPQIPPQKRKRQFKVKSHGIMSNFEVITASEEARLAKDMAKAEIQAKKRARLEKREIILKIKKEKDQEKERKKKENEKKKQSKAQKKSN